jgi:hypothetical protein
MCRAKLGGAFTSPLPKRDQSIRDYVWEAVEARLKHDLADELSAADLVALGERADQVLADLWNNPKDAAYDKL